MIIKKYNKILIKLPNLKKILSSSLIILMISTFIPIMLVAEDEFGDSTEFIDSPTTTNAENNDPLEPFNRAVYSTYKFGYDYFLVYITRGYLKLHPFFRDRLHNFAENAEEPSRTLNHLLQGRINSASESAFRFLFNTTIGLLGMWDPMSALGMPAKDNDFGATLYFYGVGNGPYLTILGPNNLRDTFGYSIGFLVGGFLDIPYEGNRYPYNIKIYNGFAISSDTIITVIDFASIYESYKPYTKQSLDEYSLLKNVLTNFRKEELIIISNYN